MGIGRQALAAFGVLLVVGGYAAVTFAPTPSTGQTVETPAITEDGLAAALAARRTALEAALAEAAPEARAAILNELGIVRRAQTDLRGAMAEAESLRGDLAAAADLYAGTASATALGTAAVAQAAGDLAAAQTALNEAVVAAEAEVSRAARLFHAAGELAAQRGDVLLAARAFVRAAALEPSYPHLLSAERWARQAGDLVTAQSYAVPLLQTAVRSFGQGSAAHGEALAAIAQTMVAASRFAEAEPLLRESIAIAESPQGTRDADYAQRLNNLGVILRAQGRTAEAERLFRQAVEVDRTVLGERHPDVPARLGNLGELLAATGRAEEAETVFRQAAEVSRQVLGLDSPETAARLVGLAAFQQANGGNPRPVLTEAEEAVRAAYAGSDALAGQLSALGSAWQAAGETGAAERLAREALGLLAVTPGKDSADYGRALNNLGLLLAGSGRAEAAAAAFREAIPVLSAALGPASAEVKTVEANLAALPPG
jgi:tetratricopeptide (TPR) repeat protein